MCVCVCVEVGVLLGFYVCVWRAAHFGPAALEHAKERQVRTSPFMMLFVGL